MRHLALLCVLVLGACAQQADAPGAGGPSLPRASGEGIVQYDGFRAARAREGDTVSSLAERVGLSPTRLGAYNGLEASHPLRAGDELVLPPDA